MYQERTVTETRAKIQKQASDDGSNRGNCHLLSKNRGNNHGQVSAWATALDGGLPNESWRSFLFITLLPLWLKKSIDRTQPEKWGRKTYVFYLSQTLKAENKAGSITRAREYSTQLRVFASDIASLGFGLCSPHFRSSL